MGLLKRAHEKTNHPTSILAAIFWLLVAVFLVIVSQLFIPGVRELFRRSFSFLFLLPFIAFSLLGVALTFLTLKKRVRGMLKKFLVLAGASAAGFFVSVALHNAFYALGVITKHITVLSRLMEALHVVFFFLAIPVCPLGFLVGAAGSIVLFIKERKRGAEVV